MPINHKHLCHIYLNCAANKKANILIRGESKISGKVVHMYKDVCVCGGGGGGGFAWLILSYFS